MNIDMISNPQLDGFKFVAENSRHHATLLMLPYRNDVWKNSGKNARLIFQQMVNIIRKYEKVYVVIDPSIYDVEAKNYKLENVQVIKMKYNDSWARDIMPSFVKKEKELRIVDFRFNAWGGEVDGIYDDYKDDDACKREIAKVFNIPYYHLNDFVLEGGSFHVDEYGTLITTEACLLSKGRNPKYSKEEIIEYLKKYLNVKKVIFIPHGIVDDETNEHIDNMACFVKDNIIALAWSNEKLQNNYSKKAYEILSKETNANGTPFKIVKIPTPLIYATDDDVKGIEINEKAKKRLKGSRLSASYINYYVGNGFVLFPQFQVNEDNIAYEIIKSLYEDYDVYRINSREILIGGGNIHCVTQQIPEGDIHYEG